MQGEAGWWAVQQRGALASVRVTSCVTHGGSGVLYTVRDSVTYCQRSHRAQGLHEIPFDCPTKSCPARVSVVKIGVVKAALYLGAKMQSRLYSLHFTSDLDKIRYRCPQKLIPR